MWINPNYLYFDEATPGHANYGADDAIVKKSTQFLGAVPSGATTTKLYFEPTSIDESKHDVIEVTHSQGGHKELMRTIAAAASDTRGKYIVIADVRNGNFIKCFNAKTNTGNLATKTNINGLTVVDTEISISGCAITLDQ
jgi:hypothetical protein